MTKTDQQNKQKLERIKEFRKEASRLASLANKRIKRLEEKGFQDSPAYQGYLKDGGEKFSIRGKSYKEVQIELGKINRLIKANTSTLRGTNKYLKEMAKNTGVTYKTIAELQDKTKVFFTLTKKIEQYLRTVADMASAIDYKQIWESVNVYVKKNKIDLSDGRLSLDQMIDEISKAIAQYENPDFVRDNMAVNTEITGDWFTLPNE